VQSTKYLSHPFLEESHERQLLVQGHPHKALHNQEVNLPNSSTKFMKLFVTGDSIINTGFKIQFFLERDNTKLCCLARTHALRPEDSKNQHCVSQFVAQV
jgi:hypothetical protein